MALPSRRRWPRPTPATTDIRVRVGAVHTDESLGALDHWLTARYRLYGRSRAGRIVTAEANHEIWPLFGCEVLHCEQSLIEAAGLPAPEGAPLAHFAPRVTVRIGRPRHLSDVAP